MAELFCWKCGQACTYRGSEPWVLYFDCENCGHTLQMISQDRMSGTPIDPVIRCYFQGCDPPSG